jgi:hypothetical protein
MAPTGSLMVLPEPRMTWLAPGDVSEERAALAAMVSDWQIHPDQPLDRIVCLNICARPKASDGSHQMSWL